MPSIAFGWSERCRSSLESSQARRQAAERARRRRIRGRGGAWSAALVALTVAVAGAGIAVGQTSATSGQTGLLSTGSRGPAVAAVQRALGLRATGHFGSGTERRVRAFQRRHGLAVDGIVGPQTRTALGLGAAASTASGGSPDTTSGASTAGTTSGASPNLQRIAQCESGGNPHAVSADGTYRGKYQFTYQTWRSVGGTGDPAAAPEAEQDRRAAMLYSRSGSGNWPVCGH